jgi:PIN domain nuclease of toxin-antitoxin system
MYLIDTTILVDIVTDDCISNEVRAIIADYENIIYVSSESIKELIHLVQIKRIVPAKNISVLNVFDFVENEFGFTVKYVDKSHLQTLAKLNLVENHNDPSDRLIISQSMTEKIPLISSDTKFPKYRKQGLELIFNR